jgi:hypothetical protein
MFERFLQGRRDAALFAAVESGVCTRLIAAIFEGANVNATRAGAKGDESVLGAAFRKYGVYPPHEIPFALSQHGAKLLASEKSLLDKPAKPVLSSRHRSV